MKAQTFLCSAFQINFNIDKITPKGVLIIIH